MLARGYGFVCLILSCLISSGFLLAPVGAANVPSLTPDVGLAERVCARLLALGGGCVGVHGRAIVSRILAFPDGNHFDGTGSTGSARAAIQSGAQASC